MRSAFLNDGVEKSEIGCIHCSLLSLATNLIGSWRGHLKSIRSIRARECSHSHRSIGTISQNRIVSKISRGVSEWRIRSACFSMCSELETMSSIYASFSPQERSIFPSQNQHSHFSKPHLSIRVYMATRRRAQEPLRPSKSTISCLRGTAMQRPNSSNSQASGILVW